MIGLELLDLVDENGVPTGEVKERELVHRDGDRHRTSHVWLFRQRNGRWQVLLQKRSEQKDSHPGCYDISSAGHIPAGVDWVSSAPVSYTHLDVYKRQTQGQIFALLAWECVYITIGSLILGDVLGLSLIHI